MKKIVVILGGVIAVVGVLASFLDQTLGFWQVLDLVEFVGNTTETTTFLSSFGQLSNTADDPIVTVEKSSIMLIVGLSILLGGVIATIGAGVEKNALAIIGTVLILVGLVYFVYALPNFIEIADIVEDQSALFGDATTTFIVTLTRTWRLGNGFFISAAGSITALVGSILKE
ncbi:MAG: hypothetical protein ACTSWW_05535 [Promethearchaeota archaeon]